MSVKDARLAGMLKGIISHICHNINCIDEVILYFFSHVSENNVSYMMKVKREKGLPTPL